MHAQVVQKSCEVTPPVRDSQSWAERYGDNTKGEKCRSWTAKLRPKSKGDK
jgi:hypothetical protein